jgi:hypothetical protein
MRTIGERNLEAACGKNGCQETRSVSFAAGRIPGIEGNQAAQIGFHP